MKQTQLKESSPKIVLAACNCIVSIAKKLQVYFALGMNSLFFCRALATKFFQKSSFPYYFKISERGMFYLINFLLYWLNNLNVSLDCDLNNVSLNVIPEETPLKLVCGAWFAQANQIHSYYFTQERFTILFQLLIRNSSKFAIFSRGFLIMWLNKAPQLRHLLWYFYSYFFLVWNDSIAIYMFDLRIIIFIIVFL